MIPRIKQIEPRSDYTLYVIFDDGRKVLYDVKDDIRTLPTYQSLQTELLQKGNLVFKVRLLFSG